MLELIDQAIAMAAGSQHVHVLADITNQWDGTSNGAIMNWVVKGQAALGVLVVLVFCWRVYKTYAQSTPGGGGGGGGTPGPAGGGGGGTSKKLLDEAQHAGIAAALIALAYPIIQVALNLFGSAF